MNQPIIEFKDEAQAYQCLKEWQARLFLDDWIIRVKLEKPQRNDAWATIAPNFSMMSANVCIVPYDEYDKNELIKYCAEKMLLHELLHIVFDAGNTEDLSSIEKCEYESLQHKKTEQMARSLIMAKYGVSADWFKNKE